MAHGRILVTQEVRSIADLAAAALRSKPDAPELVPCEDGGLFLTQFTRLARAGQAPRLCVLDLRAPGLGGAVAAHGARAVERGMGLAPTPILFYTAEPAGEDMRQLLSRVGRAVHLQRGAELPDEEQARRLSIAIEKLLVQLGGK